MRAPMWMACEIESVRMMATGIDKSRARKGKRDRMADPARLAELVDAFVGRLAPMPKRTDSVTEALAGLLPPGLQAHCRLGGVTSGSLKLLVDGASYMYELQLCKAELLEELQRLCPGAGLRRIQIAMAGQGR